MEKRPRSDPHVHPRIVLSVSPHEADHTTIKNMLTGWADTILRSVSPRSARDVLRKHAIGVVLCERDLDKGSWIQVLKILFRLPDAPPLIVTSRLADDSLWAEALNRGAYDVLAKPFDRQELLRTVNLAWLRWYYRQASLATTTTLRTAAAS